MLWGAGTCSPYGAAVQSLVISIVIVQQCHTCGGSESAAMSIMLSTTRGVQLLSDSSCWWGLNLHTVFCACSSSVPAHIAADHRHLCRVNFLLPTRTLHTSWCGRAIQAYHFECTCTTRDTPNTGLLWKGAPESCLEFAASRQMSKVAYCRCRSLICCCIASGPFAPLHPAGEAASGPCNGAWAQHTTAVEMHKQQVATNV